MSNEPREKNAPETPGNTPEGHPKRKGNELGDQAQPPSGLRPDLEPEDGGGDGGGVGKSM